MTELTPEQKLDKLLVERRNWLRIMNRIRSEIDGYEDHLSKYPESKSIKRKVSSLNKQLQKYDKIFDKITEDIDKLKIEVDFDISLDLVESEICRPIVTSVQIICNRCGSTNVKDSFNEKTLKARYKCLTCGNIKEVQR